MSASYAEFMDSARGALFIPFVLTFFSFAISVLGKFKDIKQVRK